MAVSAPVCGIATPPPTIKVSHWLEVNGEALSPDEEWVKVHTSWETTNATEVYVLGHSAGKYPAKGEVPFSSNMIMVAVGPGGRVGALAGAIPKSKPGTGRWGQIHSFESGFHADYFNDSSISREIESKKGTPAVEQSFIQALKRRGFSCGTSPVEKEKDTDVIFTLSYEPLPSLEQTPEDKKKEGSTMRQAAFTILVQRIAEEGKPTKIKLAIRPFVRKNLPKDTGEWTDAPMDAALPEAQAIMDEVVKEVLQ